jgi:DNA polymerase III epsilon subunit family exonuclease
MKNIVLIDLETTGTNPQFDKIIEVGAVKIKDMKVVDEYSSFVDPSQKLSNEITNITGIVDKDLEGAPQIGKVISELEAFVDDYPLLAHNMDFDSSFLKNNNLEAVFLDSLDLACMLYPLEAKHTQEYLLNKLCGVTYNAHRALEDASNLFTLYKKLIQRAHQMDSRVKKEITDSLKNSNWQLKEIFNQNEGIDDYLTKEAEINRFCPKELPQKAAGIPLAHLMSWLFYTQTGNITEISYWVRRKYENFFKKVSIRKCKGNCNYFNKNERLF